MYTRIIIFTLTLLSLPFFGAAQESSEYKPLTTIPGVTDGTSLTLASYLNAIFTLLIALAAIFAVVRITVAGFQYMMTDAWGSKEEAKGTIKAVLIGLIVLLLTVVILETVNPNILSLDVLNPSR